MASTTAATPSNHHNVTSPEHLQQLLSIDLNRVSVLYFRADWAEPCAQMDVAIDQLALRWSTVLFLSVSHRSPSLFPPVHASLERELCTDAVAE